MHIVKELIGNISLTSLNRFLTDQKITNDQKLEFSDKRAMLETFCQSAFDFCVLYVKGFCWPNRGRMFLYSSNH